MYYSSRDIYKIIESIYNSEDKMGLYIQKSPGRYDVYHDEYEFEVGWSQKFPYSDGVNSIEEHDFEDMGIIKIYYYTKDVKVDKKYVNESINTSLSKKIRSLLRDRKLTDILNGK